MDYQVWYLASGSDKFEGYMKIPLTQAGRNTTACVEWLVNNIYMFLHVYGVCAVCFYQSVTGLFKAMMMTNKWNNLKSYGIK